jgi:hypothetical protein
MLQAKTAHNASEDPHVAFSSDRPLHAQSDRACLRDLIEVLVPHPGGLRRWSIMRAIRSRREKSGKEISLKLEDDIERMFRKFCMGEPPSKGVKAVCMPEDALFHRPKDKAGEVWAVNLPRAQAWLEAETGVQFDAR